MTSDYEQLQEGPQTDIDVGSLNLEERSKVRRITVRATPGRGQKNSAGRVESVYYLDGDIKEAAAYFVEVNAEQLSDIDFSGRNIIQSNVSQRVYDWILHAMGERRLEKYETVVRERRPDGSEWIIDRAKYEDHPNRRYTMNETGSVYIPPEVDSEEVYKHADSKIVTTSDLHDSPACGDVRQLLDYFRSSPDFDCIGITYDDELAIQKSTI